MRVNVGCGSTPTEGWVNLDNSLSVRLAKLPVVPRVVGRFLPAEPRQFMEWAISHDVRYANALHLPFADASVDVLYSSHMFEHLDQREAKAFLIEARRCLKSDGILRLAVPDLEMRIQRYCVHRDADAFIESLLTCVPKPHTWIERCRAIMGGRHHQWMYDGRSLCRLLDTVGFCEAVVVPAGQTTIPDPDSLDLSERADESVYVEACK